MRRVRHGAARGLAVWCVWATLALVVAGCDSATEEGPTGGAGGADLGESTDGTGAGEPDAVSDTGAEPDVVDAGADEGVEDTAWYLEIEDEVDVKFLFPDADADQADADVAPESEVGPDVEDVWGDHGELPGLTDADPGDATDEGGEVGPETADTNTFDTFLSECEELGIADSWEGTFEGEIDYDLDTGGLVTPEQGTFPVEGVLFFDINCIDSKLVVTGALDGYATVVGQGNFPFTLNIGGYYSPSTGQLNAEMTDGKVVVYELIEVYFEGTFDGELQEDETFSGVWTGEALGTNTEAITGTAQGDGTWMAIEAAATTP